MGVFEILSHRLVVVGFFVIIQVKYITGWVGPVCSLLGLNVQAQGIIGLSRHTVNTMHFVVFLKLQVHVTTVSSVPFNCLFRVLYIRKVLTSLNYVNGV